MIKKDRNTFFHDNNMMNMNHMPTMMPMAPGGMMPPGINQPGYMPMPPNMGVPMNTYPGEYPTSTNLESRIAKMERQIIRLEARLNKLENTNVSHNYTGDDTDLGANNSMYVI